MRKNIGVDSQWIKSLNSDKVDLKTVGGKAANLSKLIRAGFKVQPGFVLTTDAYCEFVRSRGIVQKIQGLLRSTKLGANNHLESIAGSIQKMFFEYGIPENIKQRLLEAFMPFETKSVAVRSSATTEDLPVASFAGLHDTYLNVQGEKALLDAVHACWGSLWNLRAIIYRLHNNIPISKANIAVIVQEMVPSDVSGVLFTANPLTGQRTESVIDTTFGLGEALVSGMVEPDHFVVEKDNGTVITKSIGRKKLAIQAKSGGGTETITENADKKQALTDAQIRKLAEIGQKVEELYHQPQDIEWAFAGDALYLLQSRPITTLYPIPTGLPAKPLVVMASFAAIQGLTGPISPLGRSTLKYIFAFLARLFRTHVTETTQKVLYTAGDRLWVNFTPIISNSVGRRILPYIFAEVEPSIKQAMERIYTEPDLQPTKTGISWKARFKLARFGIPLLGNVILNIMAPRSRRKAIVGRGEMILQKMDEHRAEVSGNPYEKLVQRMDLLPEISRKYLPKTFIRFVSGIATGMASWNLLETITRKSLAKGKKDQKDLDVEVLNITRGMPYNPTTEMDLALWEIAKKVQADPQLLQEYQTKSAAELNDLYLKGKLPGGIEGDIDRFLDHYAGRGLGEIDIGSQRWAEDSTHIFEMLSSYFKINDPERQPDVVFSRSTEIAEETIVKLTSAISRTKYGWIKAKLAKFAARRARQWLGIRESPKFFVVRILWALRQELLKSGQDFTDLGVINDPHDVFFLTNPELNSMAKGENNDWKGLIQARRRDFEREEKRKLIPRLLLSDGRAFYEGIQAPAAGSKSLVGSPVSPGSATGKVRVVLDPRQANLKSGEIMVCKGTDPSWTPLFLTAGGLIMETGGMMTHGAVVAREYGIPAIVGVDRAVERLQTGEKIKMDGSSGKILLLDEDQKSKAA